ncbi:MAG: oligoendopeptidase F [Candidatus Obscuribacterales bacterium]|nr:oligoendopeptidase F [Candidatus Obscuribacterales bacterium]
MSAAKTLPARSEVPKELTWDLESVYKTDADWEADFAKVAPLLEKLKSYSGRFTSSAKRLLEALSLRDEINRIAGKLSVYANMRLHEDTTNAVYQGLSGRAEVLSSDIAAACSFMTPELLKLSASKLASYLKTNKKLEPYRQELNKLERQRPHVLDVDMEKLLAQAGEMAQSPGNIFEMLNNADLQLPKIATADGEVQLSQGNYGAFFLRSKDRNTRKLAFEGMLGAYNGLRNTMARCYAGQVKQNIFFARARKHENSRVSYLHDDNVPVAVYDNLIDTVESNLPKLHRYLRLKQKLLGLSDLHIYDFYVPMVGEIDYSISFEDAKPLILKALAPLGSEYVGHLDSGFKSRWVDVVESKGKRSGAYSWGSYDTAPFMLMNWQSDIDTLFTQIHEAGHSMHSFYTRKNQPYPTGDYTIFVAEVASICNEMLLTHHLLQTSEDRNFKRYVINHAMDAFRATLFRQTKFAQFERDAHLHAEAGETLTPEYLCGLYKGLNDKYYGPACTVDNLIEIEWARIPHFYSSFYVYKYATGLSAAVALSQQILSEGAPAVKRYLRFLSSGSSKDSLDLLRDAGVDLSTPAPIQQALDVFGGYVDEFEKLSQPAVAKA